MDFGLLIIRLVVGLTMAAHGSQKLFGAFEGHGIDGTGDRFEALGFRPGRPHSMLAGVSELTGGLLLAMGFLTPFAAAAIIGVMIVAIAAVHLPHGFFVDQGGYEHPMVMALTAVGVATAGPGAFSVDRAIGLAWSGGGWGLVALVIAIIASAAVFGARGVSARWRAGHPTTT
jgi:putative oxidoreductase